MIGRVLMVGAGGLAHPGLVALSRTRARVTVMDPDRVELSNLHRQVLFTAADVGRPKALALAEAARGLFPGFEVDGWSAAFRLEARALIRGFDLVLDATDDFSTKLELHDACREADIDYVFASAVGWSGQVMAVRGGGGPCLRCAFPAPPVSAVHPSCESAGVVGPVLGRVAARQVELAWSEAPTGSLHQYDGRSDAWFELAVDPRPDCPGCRGEVEVSAPSATVDGDAAPVMDLRGLRCPDTYVETRRRLEQLQLGARLWVGFDSDESARQVPLAARAAGHRVLASRRDGADAWVLLERGS